VTDLPDLGNVWCGNAVTGVFNDAARWPRFVSDYRAPLRQLGAPAVSRKQVLTAAHI